MRDVLRLCASTLLLLAIQFQSTQGQVIDSLCPTVLTQNPVAQCAPNQCVNRNSCILPVAEQNQGFVGVCCQFGLISVPCLMCITVQGQTVPGDVCSTVVCPVNFRCQASTGPNGQPIPECVPVGGGVTCVGQQCPPGSVCEVVNAPSGPFVNCRSLTTCPALAAIIPGATLSTTSVTIDTTVTITCTPPSVLVGAAQITCRASGSWDPTPPMCQATSCPVLIIPNGAPTTTAVTPGTQVVINCNAGFSIVGSPVLICGNTGNWQPAIPFCQPNPCPPINIPNAVISTSMTTLGTQATIQCSSPNFRLIGSPVVTCAVGGWTPALPTCQLVQAPCPVLFPFANAIISTNANNEGTQVIIRCNTGFTIDGQTREATILCSSGAWRPNVPICRPIVITCPALNIANAVISPPQAVNVGVVVSIQCLPGFTFEGLSNQIRCEANGQWSPAIPVCRRVLQCPLLAQQVNIRQDNYQGNRQINSVVSFACIPGYVLDGRSSLRCLPTGQWDGPAPACRRTVTCTPPPPVANGRVDVRGDGRPGSLVVYTCDRGYILQGPGQGVCQNGQYSPPPPPCALASCNLIAAPTNGAVNITSGRVQVGAYLGFSCRAGYRIQGSGTLRCLDNGAYDRPPPVCIAAPQCPVLQSQPSIRRDDYQGNRQINSVVSFSCVSGYVLDGRSTLRCQSNGQWDGQAPVCRISGCPTVPGIGNGRADTSDNRINAVVRYTCNSGFSLRGSSEIRCIQRPGQSPAWEPSPPTCERVIACPSVPNVQNGRADTSDNRVNAVVRYTCNSGFSLRGSGELRCIQRPGQNPNWEPNPPTCERVVACPGVPNVQNGRADTTDNRIDSVVRFTCNPGYAPSGPTVIRCIQRPGQNPNWEPNPPVCNFISVCPAPPNVANGQPGAPTGNQIGARVTYTCASGFELLGSATIECIAVGPNQAPRWSTAPTCRTVRDCGPLPNLANAAPWANNLPSSIGTVVSVSCNMGFNPQVIMATCSPAGRWMYSSGCTAITCTRPAPPRFGTITTPSNANRLGSTITVACNSGYQLAGPNTLTCQLTDRGYQYSPSVPQCIEIMCMSLISPTFGRVSVSTSRPGGIARYSCDPGYNLRGSEQRTCGQNGQWTGSAPICEPVDCGNTLPRLANTISQTTVPAGTRTTYRGTVAIPCADGFLPEVIQVTCSQSAVWETAQTCTALPRCPTLRQPNQAGMTINGFTITFTCGTGFRLEGPETIVCNNGRWSSIPPVCVAVNGCPTLSDPANGRIISRNGDGRPGSTVEFTCFSGFQRVPEGSRILTCLGGSNTWDRPVPRCVAIRQCSQFANPQFGLVTEGVDSAGRRTATFRCNTGYQIQGQFMLTCINGAWSGSAPICVPTVAPNACDNTCSRNPGSFALNGCGQTAEIFNGCRCYDDMCNDVNCVVSYRCVPGYVLRNNPGQRVCQSNGLWSRNEPTCVAGGRSQCRTPIAINGGTTRISGLFLEVICNTGFTLNGPRLLECGTDGMVLQSSPISNCVSAGAFCTPLSIPNGIFRANGNTPGAQGEVICNSGFGLNNPASANVRCLDNGRWSAVPTCNQLGSTQCSRSLFLQFGTVTYATRDGVTQATFRCNTGYTLQGATTLLCRNNANYEGNTPVCTTGPRPLVCSQSLNFPNGRVTYQTVGPQTRAVFACNSGYTLVGGNERICTIGPDATYGALPTCQRGPTGVTCPSLTIVGVRVSYTRNGEFGSVASFTCIRDNRPLPTTSRCEANGNWQPQPPTACDAPTGGDRCARFNVVGGQVRYNNNVVVPGTTADSVCPTNAVLDNRNNRVVCQQNGQWSPAQPTRCVAGPTARDFCTRFNVIEGQVRYTGLNNNLVVPGTTADSLCQTNAALDNRNNRVICQQNGQWSPAPPTRCVVGPTARDFCTRFNVIGGEVRYGSLNNNLVVPGTTADSVCQANAVLDNRNNRVVCQQNGQWSPARPTRCVAGPTGADYCQRFNVAGGQVRYTNLNNNLVVPGSVADSICSSNAGLDNNNNRVICQQNRQWSPTPPTRCVGAGPQRNCAMARLQGGSVRFSQAGNPGSTAIFLCNNQEIHRATCTGGQWLPVPPSTCGPVRP